MTAGFPQGSRLYPSLFTIYCYDIPTHERIKLAQYAEDTAIMYTSKNKGNGSSVMKPNLYPSYFTGITNGASTSMKENLKQFFSHTAMFTPLLPPRVYMN